MNHLLMVAATLALLYFAREIVIPLAFAVILAFLLTPIVAFMEKTGLRRVPSVILTVALTGAVVGLGAWLIANQLVEIASGLPGYRANIHRKIEALQKSGRGRLGQAAESLEAIGDELTKPDPQPSPGGLATGARQPVPVEIVVPGGNEITTIWSLVRPTLLRLGSAGIVVIFTIFILIEKEDLRNRILRLAGIGQLNVMTEALDDAVGRVSRYLLMQISVNAAFAVLIGAGLSAIGIPSAALWGAVAGILRLVPYVGILMAGAFPLALSLAAFNSLIPPLMVFLVFFGIEMVTSNFVEPMLYGTHTGISSLAILVATVFWASLWGPAGLILSTPLTVCLVVLGRYIPQLSFLHVLLGDDPVLTPAAQLYQRLLAMDQQEARSVVDIFRKSARPSDLYDAVLIPALSMAEQDRHRGALDSAREEFLFLNINEMVAEFAEDAASQAASPSPRTAPAGRVLILAAHDQADEIAGAMLAQLLEQHGFVSLCFPPGPDSEDMIGLLDPGPDDLICISALQPFAFTPARSVCKRLRPRFPHARLIAGIWGFTGDAKKALARFDHSPPYALFATLSAVVAQVARPAPSAAPTESVAPLLP